MYCVDSNDGLPGELGFLRGFNVPDAVLHGCVERANRLGITAEDALVSDEIVGEDTYYRALARHLDVPFVKHWPELAAPVEPRAALSQGKAKLGAKDDGRWLIAPRGEVLQLLLKAKRRRGAFDRIAITTPRHFSEILIRREADTIAHGASHDLPDATPRLSARGAFDRTTGVLAGSAIFLSIAGGLIGWAPATDVLGCVFLASMLLRLVVCAAGLQSSQTPPRLIGDREAPTYTVLVALHNEPAVAPQLVAALKRLDYPRAKLEILLLLEADDDTTFRALYAQGLPPHIRIVVAPDGKPRTKPRALNVGLMLARGAIVTVYDAEDRPDPLQLRKAAAAFAAAPPNVACLQAKLAISNGTRGLLPSGIMEHPPQAA